ncbi:hypothetical protein [Macellibacteroides fermentans]|uniref:hypothetical protein n=1 Tax=Macellibacteroides fermentans TaxID=879969 RepID=UPI00406CCC57
MEADYKNYRSIDEIYDELQSKYNVPHFDALTLAVQIQRNEILISGLNIFQRDERPASLEAIAIALGYK